MGSKDSGETFIRYNYAKENGGVFVAVETEKWSSSDVDAVKLGEKFERFELEKEQAQLVEQALKYEKCKTALRKWSVSFVDYKKGFSDEKSLQRDTQRLERKVAINRAKNISDIKEKRENRRDEGQSQQTGLLTKTVKRLKDVFYE